MSKKKQLPKKLFFGTDQCLILEKASENFMGNNYSVWGRPNFILHANQDDALLSAVFDFTERGEYILHGRGCWNFDRALYEAVYAGRQLEVISAHDKERAFQNAKETWRENKITLAKNLLADDVERRPETNKKHLLAFLHNCMHDMHEAQLESYERYSGEENHDSYNAITHLLYMLTHDEPVAAAQKYLLAEEAKHEFKLEEHLYKAEPVPRDKPWTKKYIKETLLPALRDYENRADQSFILEGVVERLFTLHNALETDRQKVNWGYINLEHLGGSKTYGFNPRVHEITLKLKNPLVIDTPKEIMGDNKIENKAGEYDNLLLEAREKGHDGIIFENCTSTGNPRTECIVFSYEQLNINSRNRKIPVPAREKALEN